MIQKFNLIGPIEPSGLSWLINCLLELGVKSTLIPNVWEEKNGYWVISKRGAALSQWLPALTDPERVFNFDPSIEVNWSHDWLTADHLGRRTIFFTREPKTTLYSAFKRANIRDQNFEEFLLEVDPQWLLNRMQLWTLFHLLWWHHKDVHFFFFDQYKTDPIGTLRNVLDKIGLESSFTTSEISDAISQSSLEKAKEAEQKFKQANNVNVLTFNRSGSIHVEDSLEEAYAYSLIDKVCTPIYLQLREGQSLNTLAFEPHLNLYFIKNPTLRELFYEKRECGNSLSLFSNIDTRIIGYTKNKSERDLLLNVILKKITRNFVNDLAFLSNQYFDSDKDSRKLRILKVIWWLNSVGIKKIMRKFLRLKRA